MHALIYVAKLSHAISEIIVRVLAIKTARDMLDHEPVMNIPGAISIQRCRLTSKRHPILVINLSCDQIFSPMRYPILARFLYFETGSR